MKKFFLALIVIPCLLCCSSNEDESYTEEQKSLIGTTWVGAFEGQSFSLAFTDVNDATLTVAYNGKETDWKVRYECYNPPIINMATVFSPTGLIIGIHKGNIIDISYTTTDVVLFQLTKK